MMSLHSEFTMEDCNASLDDDFLLPLLDSDPLSNGQQWCFGDGTNDLSYEQQAEHQSVSYNNGGLYVSDASLGRNRNISNSGTGVDGPFNFNDPCWDNSANIKNNNSSNFVVKQSVGDNNGFGSGYYGANGSSDGPECVKGGVPPVLPTDDGHGGAAMFPDSGNQHDGNARPRQLGNSDGNGSYEHISTAQSRSYPSATSCALAMGSANATTAGASPALSALYAPSGGAGVGGLRKRKRDFVAALMEKCAKLEAENSVLQGEIGRMGLSPARLATQRSARVDILHEIVGAFNEGDIRQVSDAIKRRCSATCTLITPSVFQELSGFFAILKFFTVLIDAFPDALLQLSETQMEDSGVVFSKFNFTGTKVFGLPTDVLFRQWRSQKEVAEATSSVDTAGATVVAATSTADNKASGEASGANKCMSNLNLIDVMKATNAHNEELRKRSSTADATASTAPANAHVHAHAHGLGGSADSAACTSQPTVKLAGHVVLTFDASNKVSKFLFVWNSTSLIGQVFGHSCENIASMSQFFSDALSQLHQPKGREGGSNSSGGAAGSPSAQGSSNGFLPPSTAAPAPC